MHYVRERVQANDLKLSYVETDDQRADLLTKNLARVRFERMRDLLLDPPPVLEAGVCLCTTADLVYR